MTRIAFALLAFSWEEPHHAKSENTLRTGSASNRHKDSGRRTPTGSPASKDPLIKGSAVDQNDCANPGSRKGGPTIMTAFFDIFQAEATGEVLWLGTAVTLEDAKTRAQEFALNSPGEYLVLNQKTGDKLLIDFTCTNGSQTAD
jgi:hypothetical protein